MEPRLKMRRSITTLLLRPVVTEPRKTVSIGVVTGSSITARFWHHCPDRFAAGLWPARELVCDLLASG